MLCYHSVTGHQIVTNVCTWHDSAVVDACTNICRDTSRPSPLEPSGIFAESELHLLVKSAHRVFLLRGPPVSRWWKNSFSVPNTLVKQDGIMVAAVQPIKYSHSLCLFCFCWVLQCSLHISRIIHHRLSKNDQQFAHGNYCVECLLWFQI